LNFFINRRTQNKKEKRKQNKKRKENASSYWAGLFEKLHSQGVRVEMIPDARGVK
jgi:N-dimethylarginine dimethylaminohydrolase